MSAPNVTGLVQTLLSGKTLSVSDACQFFEAVVAGNVEDTLLSAAIASIKVRTQTPDELTGAAQALLNSATPFPRPDYPFADIVGTGGDGHNTINLSTIAAITAATCGIKIIKHGNRSISSVSGSFDLLEKIGLNFNITPEESRRQTDQFGLCFLFAPNYHSGLRHATNVRKTLKARTIFNLLGPLVNPARPPKMLLGVADPLLLGPIATVLNSLGCDSAFVVHGSGVDEVAVHGPTQVAEVKAGRIETFELAPDDFGAKQFALDELVCHEANESHTRSRKVICGEGSEAENAAVCVNVALLMRLFGHENLKTSFDLAMNNLVAGKSNQLVEQMVESQS